MKTIHSTLKQLKSPGKIGLVLIFVLLILTLIISWFYQRSSHIVIDDARIAADMINMSSEVPGQITKLHIIRGQRVRIGDHLVSIDNRATTLKLQESQHNLAITKLKLSRSEILFSLKKQQNKSIYQAQLSQVESTEALVNHASIQVKHTQNELKRAEMLLKDKLVSGQLWETRKTEALQTQQLYLKLIADLDKENAELAKTKSIIGESKLLAQDIAILKEEINSLTIIIKRHQLNLTIKRIVSPINGVIDNIFVNMGEYVVPIRRLLILHNPEEIWVEANIQETKVNLINLGDKATITLDAYPDIKLSASIVHIDNASTSQYALLPNPNPSGNFIKVTQRIAIRLQIDNYHPDLKALKPGMMVEVDIDIRR
jgi:membrane fusion protein (multidrug efflux system)